MPPGAKKLIARALTQSAGGAVRKTPRKWHLVWDQIDEMKVAILSPTAAGIWVEDGEDRVSMAAFSPWPIGTEQEAWTSSLCLLLGRIRISVTQTSTFTQGLWVPALSFPYHPTASGEKENKKLLSPHSMFHGGEKERRWLLDLLLEIECCHGNNLSPGIAWTGRKWQPELGTLAGGVMKGRERCFPTWLLPPLFSPCSSLSYKSTPILSPHKQLPHLSFQF